MRKLMLFAAIGLIAFSTDPARATTITWNLYSSSSPAPNTSLGHSHAFLGSDASTSITAYAFNIVGGNPANAGSNADLFNKYASGDPSEQGLGIGTGGDHEFNTTNFIQLDLASVLALSGLGSNLTLVISSVQSNEGFRIYSSSTLGTLSGALVQTVIGNGSNNPGDITTLAIPLSNFSGGNRYLGVTAHSAGDELLKSMSVTTRAVPEPTTALLLAIGLASIASKRRDRSA